MTKIRCKFACTDKRPSYEGATDNFTFKFEARYHPETPEDERFAKWTPSGKMEVTISNPAALAAIEVGKAYYLDLIPVE